MPRQKQIRQTLTELPAELKTKAQNADGAWFAYTGVAKPHDRFEAWMPRGKCKGIFIGQGNPNPNWKDTLQPIHEYEEVA